MGLSLLRRTRLNMPTRFLRWWRATWPLHDIAITNIVWQVLESRMAGGNTILRNSVGDEAGGGVPKQQRGLQIIVLILFQRPCTKRISCKDQRATCSRRTVLPSYLWWCQYPAVGMWQNRESNPRPLGVWLGTVPLIWKGQLWLVVLESIAWYIGIYVWQRLLITDGSVLSSGAHVRIRQHDPHVDDTRHAPVGRPAQAKVLDHRRRNRKFHKRKCYIYMYNIYILYIYIYIYIYINIYIYL